MFSPYRTKPRSFQPIYGSPIIGGSFWSSLKRFASKLFGNPLVRKGLKLGAEQLVKHAPKLVDLGVQKLSPHVQNFEMKNPMFHGITKQFGDLAKTGSDKLLDIVKQESDKLTPQDAGPTVGSGRKRNYTTRGSMIASNAFR